MVRKRKRIKRKKPFYKKKMFWLFVLVFLIIDGLFYVFVFSQIFQIKEIKISGSNVVANEILEKIVASGIEKKVILPTKAIFLADLSNVEKEILNKFPEIKRAQIKREFPNTLILTVEARDSFMVFCQDKENCFKVDEEGVVFEQGREANEFFVFVPGKQIILGEQVMAGEYLQSIKEIQASLNQDLKIETKEFWLLGDRLTVKTNDGYEIYFDLKADVLGQVFNLSQVLKEKIPPEQRGNLKYIDLRFGNRVYFK